MFDASTTRRSRSAAVPAIVLGIACVATTLAQPQAREGHADVPGVRLWFTDSGGRGAAVVFVHAATGSSRVWEYQIAPFTKAGYRVITYDRRGYGRSISDPARTETGTGADDLRALADFLKLDRFHLVGTAAGGIVTLDFTLSFPDRLRSLVVARVATRCSRAGTGVPRRESGRHPALDRARAPQPARGTHAACPDVP
jgi:pimeloyl-ACP methyl ester carboxylesterase